MNKINLIILTLFLNLFFIKANTIECGKEKINNCKECGQREDSDRCGKCQEEYFPLLENLYCFACNDSLYGQVGCKGDCDSSYYSISGFAYCEKCKEGYYNLEGICYPCERGSRGCLLCTNEKEIDSEFNRFTCHKCLNEEEYRLSEDFTCVKCNEYLHGCKKCHFIGEEGFQNECDECLEGFYLNSFKTCS